MRSAAISLALGVAVAGTAWGLVASAPQGPSRVNVTITCPEKLETGAVSVGVAPWIRTVAPGDTVTWNLTNTGAEQRMTLRSDNWPLESPLTGTPDITATVPDDAGTGDYTYQIELVCRGVTVIIDPGMRVGGGG